MFVDAKVGGVEAAYRVRCSREIWAVVPRRLPRAVVAGVVVGFATWAIVAGAITAGGAGSGASTAVLFTVWAVVAVLSLRGGLRRRLAGSKGALLPLRAWRRANAEMVAALRTGLGAEWTIMWDRWVARSAAPVALAIGPPGVWACGHCRWRHPEPGLGAGDRPGWWLASDGRWYPPHTSVEWRAAATRSRRRTFWTLAIVAVVVVAALAAVARFGPKKATAAGDVSLGRCGSGSDGASAIDGVFNHAGKSATYIITISFDSPDGRVQFGTGDALVNGVAPGQAAAATAHADLTGSQAVKCRVASVTRYLG